jgi:hypothetical protein
VVREPLRGPLQRLSLVDNRNESVVWTDTVLGLECHKLLGIGRKARLLSPEEHEHAPLWRDLVFQALEAVTDTGKHGESFLRAIGGR